MTKRTRTWIYASAVAVLAVYLCVTGYFAARQSDTELCRGIFVHVVDSANQNFVTAAELRNELGNLPAVARRTPLSEINTDSLECELRVIDKIESVRVRRRTDGTILIIVEPMRPVARVFDYDRSYYINKDGKVISAEARYHVDVPVIQGNFTADTSFTAVKLLPLINYIAESPRWSALVTMVKAESPHDVLLIPAVRGLVFNIGDPDDYPSKFSRLERMIQEVLPKVGWNLYDTLSVKWKGQIVATRRQKVYTDSADVVEEVHEIDDMETMTVGSNVAAGQALPGKKANSEKPVPGASAASRDDKKTESSKESAKKSSPDKKDSAAKSGKDGKKSDKEKNKKNN